MDSFYGFYDFRIIMIYSSLTSLTFFKSLHLFALILFMIFFNLKETIYTELFEDACTSEWFTLIFRLCCWLNFDRDYTADV